MKLVEALGLQEGDLVDIRAPDARVVRLSWSGFCFGDKHISDNAQKSDQNSGQLPTRRAAHSGWAGRSRCFVYRIYYMQNNDSSEFTCTLLSARPLVVARFFVRLSEHVFRRSWGRQVRQPVRLLDHAVVSLLGHAVVKLYAVGVLD
jgi:hypothetical protein